MATRVVTRKYGSDSAKKRAKRERDRKETKPRVYVGKAMPLWISTKSILGCKSDPAFAAMLLERLVDVDVVVVHFSSDQLNQLGWVSFGLAATLEV